MKKYFFILLFFSSLNFSQSKNPALSGNSAWKEGLSEKRGRTELPSAGYIIQEEFPAGIQHILTGPDHIAFVVALVLSFFSIWQLFKIVSFFTIAHALTLTLAGLNLIPLGKLGIAAIELGVALSIAWVGIENLIKSKGIAIKRRESIAFFFGLIHGLAFSEHFRITLLDADLSVTLNLLKFLMKILTFNLGVDTGQLLIVSGVILFFWLIHKYLSPDTAEKLELKLKKYGSATVSIFGLLWMFERIVKIGHITGIW